MMRFPSLSGTRTLNADEVQTYITLAKQMAEQAKATEACAAHRKTGR
jgi:hypothetical protein